MSNIPRIPVTNATGDLIQDPGIVRHIVKVLRLGPGDEFFGYNGADEIRFRILTCGGGRVQVQELSRRALAPAADLTVAQCLIKGRRWDTFLQKVTELGVARVLPVLSRHSVARVQGEDVEKRLARWHKTARTAAAQCAGKTPVILDPMPLPDALERLSVAQHKILLGVGGDAVPLSRALPAGAQGHVALLLGPEGDFATDERDAAVRAGFTPAHLGGRILRSETAAIVATAVSLHILGALDNPDVSSDT